LLSMPLPGLQTSRLPVPPVDEIAPICCHMPNSSSLFHESENCPAAML
jgi:hypothetical protein